MKSNRTSFIRPTAAVLTAVLCLACVGPAGSAPAKRSGDPELTPEQKEALHSVILGLEALRATPDTAEEIGEWVNKQIQASNTNIEDVRKRIEELRSEIETVKKKKEELQNRLNALAVARKLISDTGGGSVPAEPAKAAPVSEAKATPAVAAGPEATFFKEKVWPILESKCIECHGQEKQKSDLRLDSREAVLKGSEYGPVLEPGNPDKSPFIQAILYKGDVQMPPKTKLPDEEIQTLVEWVKQGAVWAD